MEKVNQRLRRTVEILEAASIDYAVVGGHAVAAWVAQVDEAAVRNTRDVDVLIRPEDLDKVKTVMTAAGFHYRQTASVDMFVEDPEGSARDAVHVILVGQMIRPDDVEANPDIEPSEVANQFRTLTVERLVRMKLNSFRRKDQVHILDMIDIGIIDASWPAKYPAPLADRLQELLDDPHG